jgi:amino acid transporter
MATPTSTTPGSGTTRTMKRHVGFLGLTFISLGSIIGSGWLLGADKAATAAGPASLISWLLAAVILSVLALIHAELGTAYPVAGGTARFPAFAFGRMTGFVAGWAGWLQAVALAPIEVEASLQYIDNISWVKQHIGLVKPDETLTGHGLIVASILMLLFTFINIVGVKLLSDSNTVTVIWKTLIPVLTIIVLISLRFHPGNFTAGGGFAPNGARGIFEALPVGVVFAMQGFEQAIQLGGEARNPQKDMSRAILTAMAIGAVVYILLEIAFIGSLNPSDIAHNWANPIPSAGKFGPYATLTTAAGATWLAYLLYADAFISPAGTGLLYMGTTSRLSYAMSHAGDIPKPLGRLTLRGVPLWSILLAFVVGELAFLPFPSWQSLVGLVTDATAIMYAFAPVSLATLRKIDPDRKRPYRLGGAKIIAPIGFAAANLIIYWTGFDTTWKIEVGIVLGLVVFALTRAFSKEKAPLDLRNSAWVWPWLIGVVLIGWLGRYDSALSKTKVGDKGELFLLPAWIDLLVVVVFSLAIFYFATTRGMTHDHVESVIKKDEEGLAQDPLLKES